MQKLLIPAVAAKEHGRSFAWQRTVEILIWQSLYHRNPLGFHWLSPPGEMPPLLFGGKAGTIMIGYGNHYTMEIGWVATGFRRQAKCRLCFLAAKREP